jgi:hypothetical protein
MGVVTTKSATAVATYKDRYLKVCMFDDAAKGLALDVMARTGRMSDAAKAAGVSLTTVKNHISKDNEFAQAWEVARQEYADHITSLIEERAFIGMEEPIIGGKFRDQVVGTKRVYSDSLAVMHAKRYVEEYREKQQLDVSIAGGVLAVATSMPNSESGNKQWNELYDQPYEPGSIKPETPPRIPDKDEQDERSTEGAGEQVRTEAVQRSRDSEERKWGAIGGSPGAFVEEAGPPQIDDDREERYGQDDA